MLTSTKKRSRKQDCSTWVESSATVRLWLSFWPQQEPAVHHLKLTHLKVHPFGLQFETDRELAPGTPLELRLLLPPMTAIALRGTVTCTKNSLHQFRTSIRFTTIRDSDRKRLEDFITKRCMVRLRAGSSLNRHGTATPAGVS